MATGERGSSGIALRFTITRDAHPELVAELAKLDARSRAERLRALALLGLQSLRRGGRQDEGGFAAVTEDPVKAEQRPAGSAEKKSAVAPSQAEVLRDIEASELQSKAQRFGGKLQF